jgi:cytochrome c biogenesis protein ResB
MIAQQPREPWRAIWQFMTSDSLLAILLLSIAVGLAITSWLPQMPTADQVAYAQWRSEAQVRFGEALLTMQTLGLFTVMRSFGFRALLALLAGSLSLRLIESADRLRQNREMADPEGAWQPLAGVRLSDLKDRLRRRAYRVLSNPDGGESPLQADRWPWADLFPPLAHAGALLLLVGLLLTYLWGWQVEGQVVLNGERVTLRPGSEQWVALSEDARRVTHSPGITAFVEERGPGVQISATDGAGHPLPLKQATEADPITQPIVPLTEDRLLAIPEAQLVLRLAPQSGHAVEAHSPVLVQVYRSPPGRLLTETVIEGDVKLTVDNVTLEIASVPYARLTATFNPGLWPTGVGLVLLIAGLLGSVVWPARRLWLREGSGQVEGTGDLLAVLGGGREA